MGPILMVVISLAATNPDLGMVLMISYILGFSIPFFILSFFVGNLNWIKRNSSKITKIGGYIMILMGIALFFDWLTDLTSFWRACLDFRVFRTIGIGFLLYLY